jgi:hypothetical protein
MDNPLPDIDSPEWAAAERAADDLLRRLVVPAEDDGEG